VTIFPGSCTARAGCHRRSPPDSPARSPVIRAVSGRSLEETFGAETVTVDLRWLYAHMIGKYARHNGHADLVRELVDGVTGL
jgi:hypothetical protein